jgi:hypothetical protein
MDWLPDIKDSAATRAWVNRVLGICEFAATLTPVKIDDDAISALEKIVGDDEAWAAIHGFLLTLVTEPDNIVMSGGHVPVPVQAAGDKTNINPALILAIIQALASLYKWWRDNR